MAITTKNRAIHIQASLSEALFFIVPSAMVFLNPNKHRQLKSVPLKDSLISLISLISLNSLFCVSLLMANSQQLLLNNNSAAEDSIVAVKSGCLTRSYGRKRLKKSNLQGVIWQ